MKKLLLVFTVAAFLVACNGTSTQSDATSDSTNITAPADSAAVTAPAVSDSAALPADSATNADSSQK